MRPLPNIPEPLVYHRTLHPLLDLLRGQDAE